jgi:hypothetical protein
MAESARQSYECLDCGYDEANCRCDEDFMDDLDCTWCGGECEFFGNELPGYDPGWHLPDHLYACPACKGSGNRRDQVLF